MNSNDIQDFVRTPELIPSLNRAPRPARAEMEVNFSDEEPIACCGHELRPFWAEDGRYLGVCRGCGQRFTDKSQVRYKATPWIGVDLDGTLAHYVGDRQGGGSLNQIGNPIKPMLNRLKKWLAEGKTVKIFTARASSPKQVGMVKKWLAQHGLPELEVTNVKDLAMVELWDDRCVQVKTNMGQPIVQHSNHSGTTAAGQDGRWVHPSLLYRLRIFLTLNL